MNRKSIEAKDIKANIYESIELIADIGGLTNNDVAELEKKLNSLFDANIYTRENSEIYSEELEDYQKRNGIILNLSKVNYILEKENVLRYFNKSRTEQICICTKFISMKLDYSVVHSLKNKIHLFTCLLNCCCETGSFYIHKLMLRKNNAIICGSLYRMYQCFDKAMFGDISSALEKETDAYKLKNSSIFGYDNYLVSVDKEVSQGTYMKENSYRGTIKIEIGIDIGTEADKSEGLFEEHFKWMNNIIFKIFIEHITNGFAEDLIKGSTNKVKGGFNVNENFYGKESL